MVLLNSRVTSRVPLALLLLPGSALSVTALAGPGGALQVVTQRQPLVEYSVEDPGDGRLLIFTLLFTVFADDTAAFFVGRALGRHKLAPSISMSSGYVR